MAIDVRKSITLYQKLNAPVPGMMENMSSFVDPKCSEITPAFGSGAGEKISRNMLVPLLGSIPVDPALTESYDKGQAFVHQFASTPTAKALIALTDSQGKPEEV